MRSSDEVQTWPIESLRQEAFGADGERGFLVGPHGDVAWMCFPSWDSPAVLSGLLGGEACYVVGPSGRASWGGTYVENTLVWQHRWVTADGELECRDALAHPGRRDRAVLLRRLTGIKGAVPVRLALDLRADFDRRGMRALTHDRDGTWRGRCGDHWFSWSGSRRTQARGTSRNPRIEGSLRVAAGETVELVLALGTTADAAEPVDPREAWTTTFDSWSKRVSVTEPGHANRDAAHARAVLTGLTSAAGGMVAAATTSLPERAEQGRDYDYRYAWIRDQCFAGHAALCAGDDALFDAAVGFVGQRLHVDGPELAPAYTIGGQRIPEESRLSLPGYPGGGAIVGNRVATQHQLDVFGDALVLFAAADGADRLDADGWAAARIAADAIEKRHREPDAGIWELEPRLWTHSRLACAGGLRALAARPAAGTEAAGWAALADDLIATCGTSAVHTTGRWQRAPDDDRVDAALLLGTIRGALPTSDPRSRHTLDAVIDELTDDGFVYRFRHDERPLNEAEGAFLLCGFALSLALLRDGRVPEAVAWFERSRTACGSPGLMTEEYDVRQRQLRGNVPQAFVHALLLECTYELGQQLVRDGEPSR